MTITNADLLPFLPAGFVPSPYQAGIFRAVKDPNGGNIIIKATAGSGKTTTAEHSVRFVPQGASVCVLCYNNPIARELERRMPPGTYVATFNSVGHRSYGRAFPRATLDTQNTKMNALGRKFIPFEMKDFRSEIMNLVRKAKVHGLVPTGAKSAMPLKGLVPDTDAQWLALAKRYAIELPYNHGNLLKLAREILKASVADTATFDFDDQIFMSIVLGLPLPKYDFIIVDEAQDTSEIQIEMIRRMGDEKTRYLIVGDKNQSINAFRGADHRSMDILKEAFNATELPLTVSYRCAQKIVAVAREFDPAIEAREGAPEGIVAAVGDARTADIRVGDMVLSRTNAPLLTMAYHLLASGKPVRIQGRDFLATIVARIKKLKAKSPADLIARLVETTDMQLARLTEDDEDARQNLIDQTECIKVLVQGSMATTVEGICDDFTRLFDGDGPTVLLSSGHRAKGLEADRVFVLNHKQHMARSAAFCERAVRQGRMTHEVAAAQLQQEKNCCFVMVTRAKNEMYFADL